MPTHADEVIAAYDRAKSERGVWESHWQRVADLVLPTRQFTTSRTPGDQRTRKIYDSTASKAVDKLAAAIHGLLTNPATQWFGLRARDDALNTNEGVYTWLTETRNRMLAFFGSSRFGFNTQAHEAYLDICAFGTAVMILSRTNRGLRFLTRPLSECFLDADAQDHIDTCHRRFKLQLSKAVESFGAQALGDERMRQLAQNKPGMSPEMEILHSVYPRRDRLPGRRDVRNKPFASVYIDLDKRNVMLESGLDEFPYLAPRWSKASGEVYGRSPAMAILPDIGMVNAMRKTNIVGAEQSVAPPWVVDSAGIEGPVRIGPNSITYKRQGFPDPIKPLITGARVDLGEAILDKERRGIQEGFFLDMLTLPEIDRMTTVEVMQRIQQRMVFMSPMLSRLQGEFLGPLIARTYETMLDDGLLPPVPEELAGQALEVDFVSIMALSQRASESINYGQWIAALGQLAQADPSVLDHVNTDEVARYSASTWYSVPGRLRRTQTEVDEIRQRRAQAQQEQQQMVQAAAAAAAGKDAGKAAKDLAAAGIA